MKINARGHFSLIELLIVIAIFSFLVALLMPALRNTTYKAQTLSCANNLKVIGVTTLGYSADHDDAYPSLGDLQLSTGAIIVGRNRTYNFGYHGGGDVKSLLAPYLDDVSAAFSCPLGADLASGSRSGYSYWPDVKITGPDGLDRKYMMMREGDPYWVRDTRNGGQYFYSRIMASDRCSRQVTVLPPFPGNRMLVTNHFEPGVIKETYDNIHWKGFEGGSSNWLLDDGSVTAKVDFGTPLPPYTWGVNQFTDFLQSNGYNTGYLEGVYQPYELLYKVP